MKSRYDTSCLICRREPFLKFRYIHIELCVDGRILDTNSLNVSKVNIDLGPDDVVHCMEETH